MLTSPRNPRVATAARLRKRAFREHDRRFLLEGAHVVREALRAGRLEMLFTDTDAEPLAVQARQSGVVTVHVAADVVRHLTSTVTPQALVGVAGFLDVGLDEALDAAFAPDPHGGCLALLHEVRDPGNAGTVLRSADAAGAAAVVFSETSVDVYNPKTVRASAGSIFHLPVVRGAETLETIERARAAGGRVLAMTGDGDSDLYRTDLSGPVVFVFGNEAHGLPGEVLAAADARVRVPQSERAESLNLAAASSVCLFEWKRRRSQSPETLENIIGAAAHDIRSPLTAMKGFGYALERRWDSMTEEQRALMLQGIVHDADRMDTVLRQLVDAARVLAGTLEIFREQVDVGALVAGLAQSQRRDPDHPPVEWVGGDVTVFADPLRLKTAVLAFCESLVWWGTEGSITVAAEAGDGTLRLRASRPASGLTPDDVEALFTPRKPGEGAGSKIGLFAARGVAAAQGGRCWGSVDGGTLTFHLELPPDPNPVHA
ncbi:MAG TPA: TrmH family RNA methyltransferase [Actinomycetota bacterium]